MGVFAWFSRKGKESAAASTEETATTPVTAAGDAGAEAEASGTAPEPSGTADAEETAATSDTAAEGVDIPKQQSAEEAADNEAGEGARK
ncbi:hypothetical protein ACF1G0_27220 [Streptomyces sp. NPDC013953]|uniref:hypothetical protein n=1 Tax=Streptomyces sp. NPDC013953 TaxID=3364868 RepID=UPI0036FAD09E